MRIILFSINLYVNISSQSTLIWIRFLWNERSFSDTLKMSHAFQQETQYETLQETNGTSTVLSQPYLRPAHNSKKISKFCFVLLCLWNNFWLLDLHTNYIHMNYAMTWTKSLTVLQNTEKQAENISGKIRNYSLAANLIYLDACLWCEFITAYLLLYSVLKQHNASAQTHTYSHIYICRRY
jgi:hypothetical protein